MQLWSSWKIFSSVNERSKCYCYLELNFTMVYTRREYLQLRIRWKIWWRIDEMILFCYVTWNSILERNARANKLQHNSRWQIIMMFPGLDEGLVQLNELKPPERRWRIALDNLTHYLVLLGARPTLSLTN